MIFPCYFVEKYKIQIPWLFWVFTCIVVFVLYTFLNTIWYIVPTISCIMYFIFTCLKLKVLNKRNCYVLKGAVSSVNQKKNVTEDEQYYPRRFNRYILILQPVSWYILIAMMSFVIISILFIWLVEGFSFHMSGFMYSVFIIMFSIMFERCDDKYGHKEVFL